PLTPLTQADEETVLTWDTDLVGPVLDDTVLVAVPDMHLGAGAAGDLFAWPQHAAAAQRFKGFVDGLAQVAPQFPKLEVLQLGDLYDVWRAYPEYRDHPTSDYRKIEDAYSPSLGILLQKL